MERSVNISRVMLLCGLLTTSLLSGNIVPNTRGSSWTTEEIDSVYGFPDIAMDSDANAHVAYFNSETFDLNYSRWTGSNWETTIIDSTGSVGWNPSIAVDSANHPHISYHDYTSRDLKYATWTGSEWRNETVDSFGDVGISSSVAIDSLNRPHIAYLNKSSKDLKYARWAGFQWMTETVDHDHDIVGSVSLDLDSLDRPHILYYDESIQMSRYAHWNGTGWVFESLDFAGRTDRRTLNLDSLDKPHVALQAPDFRPENPLNLYYSRWNGSAWMTENVSSSHHATGQTLPRSLTLDRLDRAHIVFENTYAFWNGAHWVLEDTSAPSSVGWASIAVDGFCNPHIVFGDVITRKVLYATRSEPLMPDLLTLPNHMHHSPEGTVGNQTEVNITASIFNVGMMNASSVVVRFYDGSIDPQHQIGVDIVVPDLPLGGESVLVSTTWNATPLGNHSICVVADPDDIIVESNESNNMACRSVEVVSVEPPAPPSMLSADLTGPSFVDVEITWFLSPDDQGGLRNVVKYYLFRGEYFGSNMTGYVFLHSVSSGISSYINENAGEGDSFNHFYTVCAVTAFGDQSCSTNQAAKFTRPLEPGPNLVSVPLIQSNESIETVLQTVQFDKAWFYDSSSQEWKWFMKSKGYRRGLWNMNHTMGVWVNVTEGSNLTVAGIVPAQTRMHMHEGWNLVSFPSFISSYMVDDLKIDAGALRVEGYDSAPPYHLRVLGDAEVLQAGEAYWVETEASTDWLVNID